MAAKLLPCDGAAQGADGRSAYVFLSRDTENSYFKSFRIELNHGFIWFGFKTSKKREKCSLVYNEYNENYP